MKFVPCCRKTLLMASLAIAVCAFIKPAPVCGETTPADSGKMKVFIDDLMSKMTPMEKIGQLNQVAIGFDVTGPNVSNNVVDKIKSGRVGSVLNCSSIPSLRALQDMVIKNTRLKIPILFGFDVIHGYRTVFPVPLALSASWDLKGIEQTARIAAIESTADGLHWTFSPMVDIARDPRWGRICEGAGEDSYYGSLVAAAMVKGYQGDDLSKNDTILACVKHFGLYGASMAGRDYNSVDMSQVQMFQDYFGPYEAAINAGAATVMTSFNDINGIPATGNKWLLTDLLRDKWGFEGFVITDYNAVAEMLNHAYVANRYDAAESAMNAGVDMDMVDECYLDNLIQLVKDGKISQAQIDTCCRRVLEAKYKLGLFEDPYRYLDDSRPGKDFLTADHRQAARDIARKSCVLLKNSNQTLPLNKQQKIALVGPLAKSQWDLLGSWSGRGWGGDVVSLYDGIKNKLGGEDNIIYARGADITDKEIVISRLGVQVSTEAGAAQKMIDEAVAAAQKADIVVAVVGEQGNMSGEARSFSDISIPETQKRLLKALKAVGKPLVVVLMNGRPMTLVWEDATADAMLETWFSGVEGGNAIADVLYGDYNPSGKLTTTFPRNVGQIPIYYNHKITGRPFLPGGNSQYCTSYMDVVNEPLYPFGYGLSYSKFEYSNVTLSKKEMTAADTLEATVTVKNASKYAGSEVVQLYIRDMVASITPAVKLLKGFEMISLAPGESKTVKFAISEPDLRFYNSQLEHISEPGEFKVYIGTNSRDCQEAGFTLK